MAKKEKVRFYRAKLPMIVWDPRKNRALCSFDKGHIITEDDYTIERCREIGYPEVAIDAVRPPEIVEEIQPEKTPDVKMVPPGLTEAGAAQIATDEAAKTQGNESSAPDSPAAGATKGKKAKKASNLKKSTRGGPKRTIKRRDK